jgi:hypothetical protein
MAFGGKSNEYGELQGVVQHSTPKAWLFLSDFMEDPVWIPRSQATFEPDTSSSEEGRGTMKIKQWLIDKNGYE